MLKKAITYIISFILSLCILLFSSLLIFSGTVFNKQYMISVLEKNNYYERTYEDIKDGFKNYIMQSGLEESILEGLCSKEQVEQDINIVIEAIYENKEVQISSQNIRKELDNRISKVLKQNNREPDAEEREAIKAFEDAITETYENGISYSSKVVEQIGDMYVKISPWLKRLEIVVGAAMIILVLLIFIINRNLRESAKSIGVGTLTSGILMICLKLLVGDKAHYILILNETFSICLRYIISSLLTTFLLVGIVLSIIGIISIIIGSIPKKEE